MQTQMSPHGSKIVALLRELDEAQVRVYMRTPLALAEVGVNGETWYRLDRAARAWLRDPGPDRWSYTERDECTIDGLVLLELGGVHRVTHRVTHIRNLGASATLLAQTWVPLVQRDDLPDNVVELIYPIRFSARAHTERVDISALLAASGVVGDGVTDDTAAIQRAIDAATDGGEQ